MLHGTWCKRSKRRRHCVRNIIMVNGSVKQKVVGYFPRSRRRPDELIMDSIASGVRSRIWHNEWAMWWNFGFIPRWTFLFVTWMCVEVIGQLLLTPKKEVNSFPGRNLWNANCCRNLLEMKIWSKLCSSAVVYGEGCMLLAMDIVIKGIYYIG